jgi:hypothetical protein
MQTKARPGAVPQELSATANDSSGNTDQDLNDNAQADALLQSLLAVRRERKFGVWLLQRKINRQVHCGAISFVPQTHVRQTHILQSLTSMGAGQDEDDNNDWDMSAVAEQFQQLRCESPRFKADATPSSSRPFHPPPPSHFQSKAQTGSVDDAQRRERAAHVAMALANALLGDDSDHSEEENDNDSVGQ